MEISEIKQRLTISKVLQHYNLKPDRNNMLKCPFHADDTASMKIYPQTNTCPAGADLQSVRIRKLNNKKDISLLHVR
jgi:hypothetical protein